MSTLRRYAYTQRDPQNAATGYAPLLPLRLEKSGVSVDAVALLDSGASVNVLPYSIGVALGLDWDTERGNIRLSGNLSGVPSRVVLLMGAVDGFAPAALAFTWTQTDAVPLILGQVNFFMEFAVCFFRSEIAFEVTAKTSPNPAP